METLIIRQDIEIDSFLPIFIESSLVLIFGVFYAGFVTLSKMGLFSKKWMSVGYLFWVLQTYCLYDVAILIHSDYFTVKVLMVLMMVYIFVPHLYFYIVDESEKRYVD